MADDGNLRRKHGESEWSSPTFVVPKKDKRIRVVSDFREVNKLIRRKPYPMPKIHESIQKRSEYTHFTKMDLSMQFYCFELEEETRSTQLLSLQMANFTSTTGYQRESK